MSLQQVSRGEWAAAIPTRKPNIIRPSRRKGVVLHWNGPPLQIAVGRDHKAMLRRETAVVKAIQRFHQKSQKWSDAAYSYMVGQSGTIFEVRGHEWDQFANGKDSVGKNDGSDKDFYTVMVLIGEGEKPTPAAVDAVSDLVAHLRGLGAGNRVFPHNVFKRKTCPGPDLIELAKQLDKKPVSKAPMPETKTKSAKSKKKSAENKKIAAKKSAANKKGTANKKRPKEPTIRMEAWAEHYLPRAKKDRYSGAVELWQRSLLASGIDPGPVDGLVGGQTIAANRKYMARLEQPEADRPPPDVWSSLLLSLSDE